MKVNIFQPSDRLKSVVNMDNFLGKDVQKTLENLKVILEK